MLGLSLTLVSAPALAQSALVRLGEKAAEAATKSGAAESLFKSVEGSRALIVRRGASLYEVLPQTRSTAAMWTPCGTAGCPLQSVMESIDQAALEAVGPGLLKPVERPGVFATISPRTLEGETLENMINNGLDVARVNYSHGTPASNAQMIREIRETARKAGREVAVIGDVQGPKIRIGQLAGDEAELVDGSPFTLVRSEVVGDNTRASVDFPELFDAVKSGDEVLLDDGNLILRVVSSDGEEIVTTVEQGGTLLPRKGVIVPNRRLPLPGLTPVDEANIVHQVEAGVDAIALSFVRDPATIRRARQIAAEAGRPDMIFIAKVEDYEGLDRLADIAKEADLVMMAQGDLGVLIPEPELTRVRGDLLATTEAVGTRSVVATRVLESMMVEGGKPTAIEIARIKDMQRRGVTYVMLSNETASGEQPSEAVAELVRILQSP